MGVLDAGRGAYARTKSMPAWGDVRTFEGVLVFEVRAALGRDGGWASTAQVYVSSQTNSQVGLKAYSFHVSW